MPARGNGEVAELDGEDPVARQGLELGPVVGAVGVVVDVHLQPRVVAAGGLHHAQGRPGVRDLAQHRDLHELERDGAAVLGAAVAHPSERPHQLVGRDVRTADDEDPRGVEHGGDAQGVFELRGQVIVVRRPGDLVLHLDLRHDEAGVAEHRAQVVVREAGRAGVLVDGGDDAQRGEATRHRRRAPVREGGVREPPLAVRRRLGVGHRHVAEDEVFASEGHRGARA